MPAKREPQLEWRFSDEEGADDAAWQIVRLTSAGSAHPTAQPCGASKQPWLTRGWLDLLTLAALVATLLWVWPWQSRGETSAGGSSERKMGQHKEVAPPLAQSMWVDGEQMDLVEQHCSQLPPDAMPNACQSPLSAYVKAASSRPMDAIEQLCYQLPPDFRLGYCDVPEVTLYSEFANPIFSKGENDETP